MPINFNFKSFTDYLFPTSTKTDGASGAGTAQAGNSRPSFSFSAMRNSGWAKKCAAFDAAKLARTISNDPRTKKAVETAKSGLTALYKQMTALVKNLRAELNTGGHGGYRPTEEQRIHGQWRAFLPPGAAFLPGTTIDPHSRMERVRWHMGGFQWTSTHNPKTGERTSSTPWSMMDGNGWQHSQWIDHRTGTPGTHWFSAQHTASGRHTSHTAWSAADTDGWQRCKMLDHKTNTHWSSFHHAATNTSFCRTEWSKPGEDGVKSRKYLDQTTGTLWHETLDTKTGEHVGKTDWHPDAAGARMQRLVKDHRTGETRVELEETSKPSESFESNGPSVDTQGKSAEKLAADSLAILGLGQDVTDKAAIKKQYRKLALEKHPDKLKDKSDTAATEKAAEDFHQLQSAYTFLMSDQFPVQKAGE